jgi:predicted ATPase
LVDGFGGSVGHYRTEGILAYFGFPQAHEDDPERAVRAGLGIVEAIRRLESGSIKLRARIGIATGLVVVGDPTGEGRGQQAVLGETPHLAVRFKELADPETVVISAGTRRLVGSLFEYLELGPGAAADDQVPAWRVLGPRVVSRFEALRGPVLQPLVGRDDEIDVLMRRWARAKAGDGQVMLISGEPGIGKSRIAAELLQRIRTEPHLRLRCDCSPYRQDSPLFPVIDQIGRAAGFARDDPPETKLEKLESLLARAGPPDGDVALIADLLSLPESGRNPLPKLGAQRKKERTLEALLRQLEGLAAREPVLVVFEDVHWIDPTSRELLDLCVARAPPLRMLLIVTFRHEFHPPWTEHERVGVLALNRLDRRDRTALATQIAGGKALPGEVVAQIVAKTDGVPLFVEELTKAVLESGLLVAGPQGWRLDRPLPPFAIPATLQDSLAARLDRLAPVKEVAQIGAVIGREFSYPLLRAVAGRDEPALLTALVQLEEAELLFRSGAPPDARYTFKHALVQDTAYETLLKSRRRILHRQIADVLRGEFAAVAAAEPELVAHHLTQAGLDEAAIEWWGKAGHQALRSSAFKEAAAHLGKAIGLADKLVATAPGATTGIDRLRLQTSFGNALMWAKGYRAPETSAAFARARELASRVEDASERFSAYYGIWVGHINRCEPASLREMAELFMREATARPNCPEALVARRISGATCFYFGDFAGAHDDFQKAIELYDRARHPDFANRFGNDPRAAAEAYDALALWGLGRVDEALPLADRALADAELAAHPPTMANALLRAALLGLVRCNPEAVATYGQALADIASRYDLVAFFAGFAVFLQGWAKCSDDAGESRVAEMRRGLAMAQVQGMVYLVPSLEAALAEAEAGAGGTDAGLRRLDDALAEAERTEQRWYEAEMHRIRAGILLRRNPADTAAAEQSLRVAIAIAQSQKARSFELRAALSLARLYRAANRDADAHAVLASAVEGFPPTRQFRELTEAQALLAALNP